MSNRSFHAIAYDVPNDKRRLKVARLLERYGERVQYSVFEMWLTAEEAETVRRELLGIINEKEDQIRIYRLCEADVRRIAVLGNGEVQPPPGPVVVL